MTKAGPSLHLAFSSFLLGIVLFFSACALRATRLATSTSSPSSQRTDPDNYWKNGKEGEKIPPPWIQELPERNGFHFFIGESRGAADKEQALEKAWISAFVRAGMTQFPELTSLTTESVENLKASSFERHFVMKLERVNWAGMEEATDLGSPFVHINPKTKKVSAYRLLRWADSSMTNAQKQVREMANYHLPRSPEALIKEERKLVEAVQAIEELNDKISRRNSYLEAVFSKVKCGVTIKDLVRILGKPDRENNLASRIIDRQLFWGQFRVERMAGDPGVGLIERENSSEKQKWVVCRSSLHAQLAE